MFETNGQAAARERSARDQAVNDDPAAFPVEEHQRLAAGIRHAAVVVGNILQGWIDIRSVLDLGCGTGIWLSVLSAGGRREVFGVEGEAYDQGRVQIDPDLILTADLGQPLDLHRRFDLAICLEVAEHIDATCADTVVASCARHADLVLFSAALPGQQGLHHVNEQKPQYWAERFAHHGFVVLDAIRPRIWDDPQIPVWYRQNILLFVRDGSAAHRALETAATAAPPPFAVAHPELLRWISEAERNAARRADAALHDLIEVRAQLATALADVARQGTAVEVAQSARDAALQHAQVASLAREAAEAARDETAREVETVRKAHAETEAILHATRETLAAEAAVRARAEDGLADALHQHAIATEARHAAEARLADAQRRLTAELATRATLQADLARVRREAAATAADQRAAATLAIAEARQRTQSEAAARASGEAALREAKRALEEEADARRQVEDQVYVLSQDLMLARNQVATLAWERQVIVGSALWRVMQPLRALGRRIPFALRVRLRRAIGAAETRDFAAPTVAAAAPPVVPGGPAGAPPRPAATIPAPALAALAHQGAAAKSFRMVFVSGEPENPGHVYRVQRYVEAARALGIDASWLPLRDVIARGEDIAHARVMVIWRAANGVEVAHALWVARSHGVKVLFDVDDLMFDATLAKRKIIDGIRSQDLTESDVANHFQRVREVAVQADACTATTEELARHLRELDRITFVLPNLFDPPTWRASRLAVRRRVAAEDGLIRIGYAAGTRTHQRDFRPAAAALARVLQERPRCRLVLFRDADTGRALLDPSEFPALAERSAQIEWRDRVALSELPNELARFDINLAPLEVGNPFCEAKSELKYFESALVEVCTIASPTEPMRRAIRDGVTGRLADTEQEWYRALRELIDDPEARKRMARAAYLESLSRFGPQEGPIGLHGVLQQLIGPEEAARAFQLDLLRRRTATPPVFDIPRASVAFQADQLGDAEVTVIIPLYNYAHYIEEALDSVRDQTIPRLDLVVVDDASTDDSLRVAVAWAERHAARFNRIVVLRNETNSGLGRSRNTGFNAAETPFVLPLDADNRLRPECCATLLDALRHSRAGFAYSLLQCFGAADHVIGTEPFAPMRFASSNYIDAMALVATWCWAKVGGYTHIEHGWEDYDFWCTCVEHGMWGVHVREILAEYRVHAESMLRTATDRPDNKRQVIRRLEGRHDWLTIAYRP